MVVNSNRLIKILWGGFLLCLLMTVVTFWLISIGAMGFMPDFRQLEDPKSSLASEIISADQKLLGTYANENRILANFDNFSPYLVQALIATEDARFHEHSGIDGWGLLRVLIKTGLLRKKSGGGGSTISQQLAKNLFPRSQSSLAFTKLKEWVIAVKLEKSYTKNEIIAMYFNTVDFGSHAYGIKAASKTFFNCQPEDLNMEQSAMLVGMLKAPTYYSPVRNPENAKHRREIVLSQMKIAGYITQEVYDSVRVLPLITDYSVQDHTSGPAPYFREYLRRFISAKEPDKSDYYSEPDYEIAQKEWEENPLYGWCNKNFKSSGEKYDIYKDGLKFYTTINYSMQQYAEDAMTQHLSKDLQPAFYKDQKGNRKAPFSSSLNEGQIKEILLVTAKRSERYRVLHKVRKMDEDSIWMSFNTPVKMKVFTWKGEKDTTLTPLDSIRYYKYLLRSGLMSMEPQTGYVRTYVGGINYKQFKYDHVSIGRRQVGSTFKPIIYALAMENKKSPCTLVPNVPYTFTLENGKKYTPAYSKNEKLDGKMITLKQGLSNSLNQISARVLSWYSPKAVIDLAEKMGIQSHIDPYPSICVGAPEILLKEMVAAYSTLANKGVYIKPIFVTRIEDRYGNVLSSFTSTTKEAMSEETAYLTLELMKGVIDEGTGTRIRSKYGLKQEMAGKTGTTNNCSDGWFIGITPQLVTGVWVGGEERTIRFRNGSMGQGAYMALPIWALFMQKAYRNSSLKINQEPFEKPEYMEVEIDCSKVNTEDTEDDPLGM